MAGMGNAMMGTGEAEGEGRAIRAAEDALCNPLLGELSIKVTEGGRHAEKRGNRWGGGVKNGTSGRWGVTAFRRNLRYALMC